MKRKPLLLLSATLLSLALLFACNPHKEEAAESSAYPLAGTTWQGAFVENDAGEEGISYCDSTVLRATLDTTAGNLHMVDYYFQNSALYSVDSADIAFSYTYADKSGMVALDYGDGDTVKYPFSVDGDVMALSFITLYRVK